MSIHVRIAPCTQIEHSAAILAIFNEAITHSTALYDYQPRSPEYMDTWFTHKREQQLPVLGAFDAEGNLLGFATYGAFRPQAAFKYTVEHSIYIHQNHRGKGVGRVLLEALIDHAHEQEVHCMVGVIDCANTTSIQLHEQFGFVACGAIQQAGFKFGEWLDVAFYQLLLSGPERPVDG